MTSKTATIITAIALSAAAITPAAANTAVDAYSKSVMLEATSMASKALAFQRSCQWTKANIDVTLFATSFLTVAEQNGLDLKNPEVKKNVTRLIEIDAKTYEEKPSECYMFLRDYKYFTEEYMKATGSK